jgi:ATP-dependent Clp protease, protease subunit
MGLRGIPLPTELTPASPPQDIAYASFSEEINEQSASRFIHWLDLLSNDRPRHNAIHLLFNSSGGMIVDAINMYNYVLGYPSDVPITMFNTGGVQSAGVLVFLSATHRVVCPYAKFLLHPAVWKAASVLNTEQHRIVSRSLAKNDKDIDDILKTRINMPAAKWKQARRHQLEISAQEAVDFGLASEIKAWKYRKGSRFFQSWCRRSNHSKRPYY